VARVRDQATNLAGLKVSESPFVKVEPFLDLGLPVYIGSEPLIPPAMARGALGAVSGLAAAFPDVVRAALDAPDTMAEARLRTLRSAMERHPFIASVKHVLRRRGGPINPDMRAAELEYLIGHSEIVAAVVIPSRQSDFAAATKAIGRDKTASSSDCGPSESRPTRR